MSAFGVTLFTIMFIVVGVLVGNLYTKIHVTRELWIIITALSVGLFIVDYIAETFLLKKKPDK